jgi:hypothetical protein
VVNDFSQHRFAVQLGEMWATRAKRCQAMDGAPDGDPVVVGVNTCGSAGRLAGGDAIDERLQGSCTPVSDGALFLLVALGPEQKCISMRELGAIFDVGEAGDLYAFNRVFDVPLGLADALDQVVVTAPDDLCADAFDSWGNGRRSTAAMPASRAIALRLGGPPAKWRLVTRFSPAPRRSCWRPSLSMTPIAPDSRCPRTAPEQRERRSSASTPRTNAGLARDAGFNGTRYVAGASLAERYFANRTDGLRPSSGEDLLVATI